MTASKLLVVFILAASTFSAALGDSASDMKLKTAPVAVNISEFMSMLPPDYYYPYPYPGYSRGTPDCCQADVFTALCNEKISPILQNVVRLGGTIYYFSPTISTTSPGKNWYQAQDMCRQYGMQLVSLETVAEDALVKNYASTLIAQEGSFWTSLNDLSVEGTYMWAGSGEPAWSSITWSPTLPSGIPADCGQLLKIGGSILWNDQDCKRPTRYICEMSCPCNDLINII